MDWSNVDHCFEFGLAPPTQEDLLSAGSHCRLTCFSRPRIRRRVVALGVSYCRSTQTAPCAPYLRLVPHRSCNRWSCARFEILRWYAGHAFAMAASIAWRSAYTWRTFTTTQCAVFAEGQSQISPRIYCHAGSAFPLFVRCHSFAWFCGKAIGTPLFGSRSFQIADVSHLLCLIVLLLVAIARPKIANGAEKLSRRGPDGARFATVNVM